MGSYKVNLDRIRQALHGQCGDDQRRIAEAGLRVVDLLLQKNADYGGSAWQVPILAPHLTPRQAIQCRMSDKVQRLHTLLSGQHAEVAESIEDTMQDLSGYGILWLGAPDDAAH